MGKTRMSRSILQFGSINSEFSTDSSQRFGCRENAWTLFLSNRSAPPQTRWLRGTKTQLLKFVTSIARISIRIRTVSAAFWSLSLFLSLTLAIFTLEKRSQFEILVQLMGAIKYQLRLDNRQYRQDVTWVWMLWAEIAQGEEAVAIYVLYGNILPVLVCSTWVRKWVFGASSKSRRNEEGKTFNAPLSLEERSRGKRGEKFPLEHHGRL